MKVYMIGIGGSSMSGLAEILIEKGMSVAGSDVNGCPRLSMLGVKVFKTHRKENISLDTNIVIYSSAISEDNPELKHAREQKYCVLSRGELLGLISRGYRNSIGVSGSHGKTTTTAMIAEIFAFASKNVTAHFGTDGGRRKCGNGEDIFLCEACEYKDNFLHLTPTLGICTGIEYDHPDYFENESQLENSFLKFFENSKLFLTTQKVKNTLNLKRALTCEVMQNPTKFQGVIPDFSARNLKCKNGIYSFDFYKSSRFVCDITLKIAGVFNVENALFACAVGWIFSCTTYEIQKGISSFFGVSRRMEKLGEKNGVQVVCDYAHHPTQVSKIAEIFGEKSQNKGEVLVIFQPHTFSRTSALFAEFVSALSNFEKLIITDTYPAREEYDFLGSGEYLASQTKNAKYVEFCDLCKFLRNKTMNDNFKTILFLGAGDIYNVAKELIKDEKSL